MTQLSRMHTQWLSAMRAAAGQGESFVMVTVIETSGSAPREVGARMVVTQNAVSDTIGGGQLEYEAIARARAMLKAAADRLRCDEMFGLGAAMSQCCGGAVRLEFEKYTGQALRALDQCLSAPQSRRFAILASPLAGQQPSEIFNLKREPDALSGPLAEAAQALLRTAEYRNALVEIEGSSWFLTRLEEQPTPLILFGAGHVGTALVKVLEDLPFRIQWVDERAQVLPARVPANVTRRHLKDPLAILSDQPDDAFYAVMTHSHGRDYEICREILRQRKFGWLGLIGSQTKRKRFARRFMQDGLDAFAINRLQCPIGVDSIKGKLPAVIAIATAAQLLEQRQQQNAVVSVSHALNAHRGRSIA